MASFWYLHRYKPQEVESILSAARISIDELRNFSQRLKSVRDKSFVHIDKVGVFDPEKIYEDAEITGNQIRRAVEAVWTVLNTLYQSISRTTFMSDEYSGDDILFLHEFYLRQRMPSAAGDGLS